jgi:antitoxin CptB
LCGLPLNSKCFKAVTINDNSNKDLGMALNKRKKRLKFRCWHRGSREADLLLGNFSDKYVSDMNISDLEQLESIVDCDDQDIWDWVTGATSVPVEISCPMIDKLRSICATISRK